MDAIFRLPDKDCASDPTTIRRLKTAFSSIAAFLGQLKRRSQLKAFP